MPPTVYLLSSFFPQPVKNSLSARKLMSRNTFAVYVVFLHFGICRCYPFFIVLCLATSTVSFWLVHLFGNFPLTIKRWRIAYNPNTKYELEMYWRFDYKFNPSRPTLTWYHDFRGQYSGFFFKAEGNISLMKLSFTNSVCTAFLPKLFPLKILVYRLTAFPASFHIKTNANVYIRGWKRIYFLF